MLNLLVTTVTVISLFTFTARSLNLTEEQSTATSYTLLRNKDNQCPPWTYYDNRLERCKCYNDVRVNYGYKVRCNNDKTILVYDHCMTYDKGSGTLSMSYCPYLKLQGHNISEPRMIDLPDNISQLNKYMCGPMNRKGILCSQCTDGYGPSGTSRKFQCSPCSGVWYGVPLYLFLELVPVTVFYVIVLLFQLNLRLTIAPMTGFIFYSNYISLRINIFVAVSNGDQAYIKVIDFLYGIWTLDFFRYVAPPFCISAKLKVVHILYLQCLSAIFPYILIAITWILINLYSRDSKVVVWMWKKLDRVILKHCNVKRNSDGTVVDAFAAFFLLTFVKFFSLFLTQLVPLTIFQVNNFNYSTSRTIRSYNISEEYRSVETLVTLVATLGIFLMAILTPVVIVALYPHRLFRKLLFKCCCHQFICTLNFFTEKFYSCYRDGLDGGKDMRSFASMHFFTAIILFVVWTFSDSFTALAGILGGCSLVIAIVKPYKTRYMAIIESLILANGALVLATSDHNSKFFHIVFQICATLPALGLTIFILYKPVTKLGLKLYPKLVKRLSTVKLRLNSCLKRGHNQEENRQHQEVQNSEVEIQ